MKCFYLPLIFCVGASFLLLTSSVSAQDYSDKSLEELMRTKVAVATGNEVSQAEAPSVITLITHEEIMNMGARDLQEVLQMVPNFHFHSDLWGAVGLSVRGIWGVEAKTLLLIDGQEINDVMWGTIGFGNHYTPNQIERIEIIRGPGSARYGGFAELAVINVITRKGADINGVSANLTGGSTAKGTSLANVELSAGKKFDNGLDVAAHGHYGYGRRNDGNVTTLYGNTIDLTDKSRLMPAYLNLKASYGRLSANFLYDKLDNDFAMFGSVPLSQAYRNRQEAINANIQYTWRPSRTLTITPRISFRKGTAYVMQGDLAPADRQIPGLFQTLDVNIATYRAFAGVSAEYQPKNWLNLNAGVEYYQDFGKYDTVGEAPMVFWTGSTKANINTFAAYIQGIVKTKVVNITVGGRVDENSYAGAGFAPRLALTRSFGRLNLKYLLSQAYKMPTLLNISLNAPTTPNNTPNLRPEYGLTSEFQASYVVSRKLSLSFNTYYQQVRNVIYYQDNGYKNISRTGTSGFEGELRIKDKWGYFTLTAGSILSKNILNGAILNRVPGFAVAADSTYMLGIPRYKIAATGHIKLGEQFAINPTMYLYGKRYINSGFAPNGTFVQTAQPTTFVANIFLQYNRPFHTDMVLAAGVNNVLGSNYPYAMAFGGGDPALPALGREVFLRLTYTFAKN